VSSGLPFWDQVALDFMYLVVLFAGGGGLLWFINKKFPK